MRKTHLFFIITLLISIFFIGYFVFRGLFIQSRENETRLHTINKYWSMQDYEGLIEFVDTYQKDFLHNNYVMLLKSFSLFNVIFLESINDLTNINYKKLWEVVRYIRRVIALNGVSEWEAEAYYVLGKVYYFLSKNNLNKSIMYFEKAQSEGFYLEDINEYLIAAYKELGDIEQFEKVINIAIKENPKFEYFEILLDTYLETKQDNNISDIIKKAEQFVVTQANKKSLNIIKARELVSKNELVKAEVLLLDILESNVQSAEVYFFLGNVYEKMGKMIKARFNWRQAYKLRPTWEKVIIKLKDNNS